MVNKKIFIIPIIVVIVIFLASTSLDNGMLTTNDMVKTNKIFHVTLADPDLYINGVYTEKFSIDKGDYSFRFVPNGSSPETLSVFLKGVNFEFERIFSLEGTLHQTGISEYYTWKYIGAAEVSIPEMQEVTIIINPNGNIMGSVSVELLEN